MTFVPCPVPTVVRFLAFPALNSESMLHKRVHLVQVLCQSDHSVIIARIASLRKVATPSQFTDT